MITAHHQHILCQVTSFKRKCYLLKVVALTFDGMSANFSTARILGAQVTSANTLSPSFQHPVKGQPDVQIILDACHMLKLIRNCLGDKKILLDADKQVRTYRKRYIISLIKALKTLFKY